MTEFASLLTRPQNYAVVQLPGRKYPAVVVQGDSLNAFLQRIMAMQKTLEGWGVGRTGR